MGLRGVYSHVARLRSIPSPWKQVGSTLSRIMNVKQHLYINVQTTLFQKNARLLTCGTQLEGGDLSVTFRVSQFSSCLHSTRTTEGRQLIPTLIKSGSQGHIQAFGQVGSCKTSQVNIIKLLQPAHSTRLAQLLLCLYNSRYR